MFLHRCSRNWNKSSFICRWISSKTDKAARLKQFCVSLLLQVHHLIHALQQVPHANQLLQTELSDVGGNHKSLLSWTIVSFRLKWHPTMYSGAIWKPQAQSTRSNLQSSINMLCITCCWIKHQQTNLMIYPHLDKYLHVQSGGFQCS